MQYVRKYVYKFTCSLFFPVSLHVAYSMEFTGVPVNFSDSPIPGPVMPVESSLIGTQFSENMFQPEHNSAGDVQYTETHSTLADGGHQFGVSTLCFDALQELLWMGNQGVSNV